MTEVEVLKSTWIKKGATLSDKSARKEFGLTQEEIIEKKIKKELAQTNKELKKLKIQIASLELRKAALLSSLSE